MPRGVTSALMVVTLHPLAVTVQPCGGLVTPPVRHWVREGEVNEQRFPLGPGPSGGGQGRRRDAGVNEPVGGLGVTPALALPAGKMPPPHVF